MPVETAAGIWDLVRTNPLGTDDVSEGDDHHRLTKGAILDTFPNIDEPVTATASQLNNAFNPPGAVIVFAGLDVPEGYLLCDGSAVDRTTYADLYSAIGDAYGAGDGTTTFNLPNMEDKAAGGAHSGNFRGTTSGQNTWQWDDLPAHKHALVAGTDLAAGTDFSIGGANDLPGNAANNRQATLYFNWIIKT